MRSLLFPITLALLAGCANQPAAAPQAAVNTSLSALMKDGGGSNPPSVEIPDPGKPTEVERLAQQHPVDVQAVLDRGQPEAKPPAIPPTAEATLPEPQQPEFVPPPPKSLAERIDETSLQLTDLLRQQAAASETPFHAWLSLAAMEAVRPGSAPTVITPETTDGGPLNDEQRQIINAFRDLVAGLKAADDRPGILTDVSINLGNSFLRARPMRINAALAAKVTGFGQYMPLGVSRIQQGKPMRAVVYTEVSRFTQRMIKDTPRLSEGAQPGDKWAVELSQELQLIHDADGVKAWQQAEQPIVETSRSFRSDFYLVQNITLPQTLSIGAYKLKIIVRDKSSGQEDEAVIPLEVVADPSLVSETGTRQYD